MSTPFANLIACWVLALCATAAVTDARSERIPNWLTLPSLLAAPLVHGLASGPGALGASLLGALAAALAPLVLFYAGGLGGGDLKLLSALGAILGARLGVTLELSAFVLALLFAIVRLAHRGRLLAVLTRAGALLLSPVVPRLARSAPAKAHEAIVLGPAIFVAAALTLLSESLA